MGKTCRNCGHRKILVCDEPCRSCAPFGSKWQPVITQEQAYQLLEALQKIIALQPTEPENSYDDVMDWSNFGDVYSAGVDIGAWEAARIALAALKAAGVM